MQMRRFAGHASGLLILAALACAPEQAGPAAPDEAAPSELTYEQPKEQKFVCSRDVWVSTIPEADGVQEVNTSMGKTQRLKIKTIQEMAILDFDLSPLKGKVVGGGRLYFNILHDPNELKRLNLPFERRHLLKRIGLSTVSTDWLEGAAEQEYAYDTKGCGATFLEASYTKKPWSYPGSDLSDVTMGNGNTLQHHTELKDLEDMWAVVDVPAPLIQSLIARDGFGWCIMDDVGYGLANNFIHSREAEGREPYLVVDVLGEDTVPPSMPEVLVKPAPQFAHMGRGAVVIAACEASPDTFCWFVKVNGEAVPQRLVPHPQNGSSVFAADYLEPGGQVDVEVVAVDAAGNRSKPAKARGRASDALAAPPQLPEGRKTALGEPPLRSGRMRVWAFPEVCKVDPVTGALFEAGEADAKAYRTGMGNPVWSGAANKVCLFGAKGEIVAFQLCIEGQNTNVSVQPAPLAGDDGEITPEHIRLFRVWYVDGGGEYCIPLENGGKLDIPSKDNGLPLQANQSVYVDIAVPKDAPAGVYSGGIRIAADNVAAFDLPVSLKVYDFQVPDKMRFNPELNIYRSPGRPASDTFLAAYRCAHYNRCTLSITQAGHSDGVKIGVPLEGRGAGVRVKDWSDWDGAFGPLLDGSAFKGLPRDGTPLATCQIPLSHGFPLPIDKYHIYDGPRKCKDVAFIHALMVGPIEEHFPEEYKAGFRSFARQIVEHLEEKGWTDTEFMFYLDAKPTYKESGSGTSYWILDEPYNYDDWAALRFWGRLFHEGIKDAVEDITIGYRCDISRPQWTRDWLYGVMDYMYVGGFTNTVKRCQIMAEEGPMVLYSYGACNPPEKSHWNSVAWCLQTYLGGADGVLPWQSVGGESSLRQLDQTGLILLDVLGRHAIASVRVKALRRGAQDCEYFITLAEKFGLNREQLRALVAEKIPSRATYKQKFEDEAAAVLFDALDPQAFSELREGVAQLITGEK